MKWRGNHSSAVTLRDEEAKNDRHRGGEAARIMCCMRMYEATWLQNHRYGAGVKILRLGDSGAGPACGAGLPNAVFFGIYSA